VPVDADRQEADGGLVVLHDDRHRRRNHVGGIWPEEQVDLVDGDELRKSRNVARVALVVVVDKLDRPAEQSALGVDVVAPEFKRHQNLLAIRGDPAGQG
jgi:hypothetical protein